MAKRSRPIGVFVLALVALSACAGPVEQGVWTRPDTDRRQRAHDEYECDRDVRLAYGTGAYDRSRGAPGLAAYERCMKEKGYVRAR